MNKNAMLVGASIFIEIVLDLLPAVKEKQNP
jgi:hypothetical protein